MCRHSHGLKYNLAQAAYMGKPGAELAASMGITTTDDLLYVVFSRSREELEDSKPTNHSALCIYSLLSIHRIFTENIQHCFNGNGNQGLDFINILQPCVSTVSAFRCFGCYYLELLQFDSRMELRICLARE